jgi:CRP/FNR family transcriptional regulator, cyclic AMP receptor protein
MFVIKEYRKGKTIVRQGTHGTSAFLIKKGKVEVFVTDDAGNKKVLASLKENDLFGEMAMISNDARTASVIALEDCELAILTRDKYLLLPDDNPAALRLKNLMIERRKKGQ